MSPIRLLPILLFVGCATFNTTMPGELSERDTYCGSFQTAQGGTIAVRLREGVDSFPHYRTCASGIALIKEVLQTRRVTETWTVIYVVGGAGYSLQESPDVGVFGIATGGSSFRLAEHAGMTYSLKHVVSVHWAVGTRIMDHEFCHVEQIEAGIPNTCDTERKGLLE